MSAEKQIRRMGQSGRKLDPFPIFRHLREMWLSTGKSTSDLARFLNVTQPKVSNWANGSDRDPKLGTQRRPPWWAVMRVADELGLAVLIDGEAVRLVRLDADAHKSFDEIFRY